MKKLLLLITLLPMLAWGQVSLPDSTSQGGTNFTPQWNYIGGNASTSKIQMRNPNNGKFFGIYSAYQTSQLFAPITGSTVYKLKSDSTASTGYQTVGNFFPKGDTRYSKIIQTYTYTAPTSGNNAFTYAPLASATILSINRSGANYVITGSSPTGLQVQRVTDTFTFVDNFNTSYAETIVIQYTQ